MSEHEQVLSRIMEALVSGPGLVSQLGFELELDEDVPIATVTLDDRHRGQPGIAHGGVLTAFLDTALGAHATLHAIQEGKAPSTIEIKVNFLRPARLGTTLISRCELQYAGRRTVVITGHAEDADTGERVALALGTFHLAELKPEMLAAYRALFGT